MNKKNTLSRGAAGPQTELLQLALGRSGQTLAINGIFGDNTSSALKRFQEQNGITPDGVCGRRTFSALTPYIMGYVTYTIRPGDTLYRLAADYHSTIAAIEAANPGLDPLYLQTARIITIPLGFPVVPEDISFTSDVLRFCTRGLCARYPFLRIRTLGKSAMGRGIICIEIGNGPNKVLYNASHHANEWITTPLIMKFIEDYARAYSTDSQINGVRARTLYELTTLSAVPMVNPDGVDLVTGRLTSGEYFDGARLMAENYPRIPFPSGWKANINGIDLNLQYPAGWENARAIKFGQGFELPGPRDHVGPAPLIATESRAMHEFTAVNGFRLTLSYHTQGEVIYWKYLDYEPENSRDIAHKFGRVSGYAVEETPYESGFAGYKDWFIEALNRPGYTIEAGYGMSPLPLSSFPEIYARNIGILTLGLSVTL